MEGTLGAAGRFPKCYGRVRERPRAAWRAGAYERRSRDMAHLYPRELRIGAFDAVAAD
jgi:hypothetical protein